jgi:hypothetical protein
MTKACRTRLLLALLALAMSALTCERTNTAEATEAKEGRVLRHSEVVAMYEGEPETLRAFSVDMVAWGGRPDDDAHVEDFQRDRITWHHELGIRFMGTVGIVTEFAQYMQSCPEWEQTICITPRGERLRVPWLWDLSYEGNPAYRFCTNDPRYRGFLRSQVALAARGGVDGVHIDDHMGTAAASRSNGCFCDSCMRGFKTYLRESVSPERLREAGIQDLDSLDYREFVRQWMDAEPDRRAANTPLGGEYRSYQLRATRALMMELRAVAEETAGHPLLFSGNVGVPGSAHLTDYQAFTHFTSELGHEAARGLDEGNAGPVVAYQVATALNRPLLATGLGQDWAFVKASRRPELVRTWIAQAYAFGQFFMAPHHQWCYTRELGTHWYDGTPEDYGPIYRFIHEHPFLFDDEESAAEVAVVYSTGGGGVRRGEQSGRTTRGVSTRDIVRELLTAQIPFDLLVAGDDVVPVQLTWERTRHYRKVIVPPDLSLDDAQQRVIDRLREEDRLIVWNEADSLASLPASPLEVSGDAHVWSTLRQELDGGDTVVHLLNRNYDPATDRVLPVGPIKISVKRELCGDRDCRAVLYAPGAQAMPLVVSRNDERISVEVPSLPFWAIVHLSPNASP